MDFRAAQLAKLHEGITALEKEFQHAVELDLGVKTFNAQIFHTIITKIDV